MESKIGGGGNFFVLTWNGGADKDFRLAYMQRVAEIRGDISEPGEVTAKFYDMWNQPIWDKLLAEVDGDRLEMLRAGFIGGSIHLRKLVKLPATGRIRARRYLVSKVDAGPGENEYVFTYTGSELLDASY